MLRPELVVATWYIIQNKQGFFVRQKKQDAELLGEKECFCGREPAAISCIREWICLWKESRKFQEENEEK